MEDENKTWEKYQREKSWTIYCSILVLGNNPNYSENQKLHLEEVRIRRWWGLENNLNWFAELNYWVIGYSQVEGGSQRARMRLP